MAQTILVIDDEPALRGLAEALLDELGYAVLLAESGQAAIRLLEGRPGRADAVLLDMTMPGLTPEETLRRLRTLNPQLPVIVLSAHSEAAVRERFEAGAITGYLQKPYTDAGLQAALRQALPATAAAPNDGKTDLVNAPLFKLQLLTDEEKQLMAHEYLVAHRAELPRWTHLLETGGFAGLAVAGHTLKGSGGSFGFDELTRLGGALEQAAGSQDARACALQLAALRQCLAGLWSGEAA